MDNAGVSLSKNVIQKNRSQSQAAVTGYLKYLELNGKDRKDLKKFWLA